VSTNNILSPRANGRPIINPTQDIVLGLYYMTRERSLRARRVRRQREEGDFRGIFASPEEVRMAYDGGEVELHSKIMCRHRRRSRGDHGRAVSSWATSFPEGVEFNSSTAC